jgi:hypothetical protein
MALLALLGLGLASRAQDDVLYGTGLGLFVFYVLFIFYLIHRNVGRYPATAWCAVGRELTSAALLSEAARSAARA